jgi:hypothetical protein
MCLFAVLFSIFSLGWVGNSVFRALNDSDLENPAYLSLFGENEPKERYSPGDHIKQEQIHVYDNGIVLDIRDANWAVFSDTNSMDPLFDIEANSFEIKPSSEEEVHVGDIISFYSDYTDGLTVHRVVEMDEDEEGTFYITKGDNLTQADPGKVRFEQIHGVLVGIIY